MYWSLDRGYAQRLESLDPIFHRRYNAETGELIFGFEWGNIPAWIGDRFRGFIVWLRITRDTILGIKNPYL